MSKGNRVRAQRQAQPVRETHEPDEPVNWPRGHVDSEMTGDMDDECIRVTIHGVQHYLHATTARALWKSLGGTLDEFNGYASGFLADHGITHKNV